MGKRESLKAEELLEQIFYYMNQLVNETDFSSVIRLLTDMGRTLVHSERASFWCWDIRKKQYWTVAASDSERIVVPEGSGIVGASIQNKETILINEPYTDQRFNPEVDKRTGYVTKSILCMPVTNERGEVIGAYQAINKLDDQGEDGIFDEKDMKRLTLAAVYCGKTLESHLLRHESLVDQLTGLKNRRGFYEYYAEVVKNYQNIAPISLVMCDIDFFKKVNDTYGHNAGDAVLIHVADILQQSLQTGEEVVRWGGEEFVILLRGKEIVQAADFAENLRQWVEGSYCRYGNEKIRITMSFGVGSLHPERTSDENIKDVDDKLYQAKTTGRNKVVL